MDDIVTALDCIRLVKINLSEYQDYHVFFSFLGHKNGENIKKPSKAHLISRFSSWKNRIFVQLFTITFHSILLDTMKPSSKTLLAMQNGYGWLFFYGVKESIRYSSVVNYVWRHLLNKIVLSTVFIVISVTRNIWYPWNLS